MPQQKPVLFIQARKEKEKPLFRQISDQIRSHIASGILSVDERLPGVRKLAQALDVSEDTVAQAYALLLDEGIIIAKPRSGYFVACALPAVSASPHPSVRQDLPSALPARNDKRIAEAVRFGESAEAAASERILALGAPALDAPDEKAWTGHSARYAKSPWLQARSDFSQGNPALRRILAQRLRELRGVSCDPDSLVITTGTRRSLSVALSLLFSPGDPVLLEAPTAPAAAAQVYSAGLQACWGATDDDGLQFDPAQAACRGVLVSPASQVPLGVPLARKRKKQLLIWAKKSGAVLLENDAGSSCCQSDSPEMPLRAAPFGEETVAYCADFGLLVPPACNIGFVLPPKGLEDAFAAFARLGGSVPDEALQKTLAAFLESPAFDGRIKKLTALSRERHAFLLEAADTLGLARHGRLTPVVNGVRAGFVLSAECACCDTALLAAIGKTPVALGALSAFPAGPAPRNGFVINFASGGRDDLRATLERLGAALEKLQG